MPGRAHDRTSATLATGIRVRQAYSVASQRSTYLVTCMRTGASALVDPLPEARAEIVAWLDDEHVRLRYELHTRSWSADARSIWLEGLQSRLGLAAPADETTSPAPWLDQVHARVLPVRGDDDATTYVRVGTTVLAMPHQERASNHQRFTLVSAPPEVPLMRIGSLRIALGAFHVAVLPVPGHPERVSYHVADRLFFPGSLRAGTVREPEDGLTDHLGELPPETLVYATSARRGVTVSTVGVEAALAHRQVRLRDLDDDTIESLSNLGFRER